MASPVTTLSDMSTRCYVLPSEFGWDTYEGPADVLEWAPDDPCEVLVRMQGSGKEVWLHTQRLARDSWGQIVAERCAW